MNLEKLVSDAVIENRIVQNEQHVRRKIMEDLLSRFIPHVTKNPVLPASALHTESKTSSTWSGANKVDHVQGKFTKLEHSTDIQIDITTDQPVTNFQALYAAGGSVASGIVDEVMSHIRSALTGSDDSKSQTRTRTKGNELTEMEQRYV